MTSAETVDSDVTVTNGNLVIKSGGRLEIRSAVLTLRATPPHEPSITIESGGELYLNGTNAKRTIVQDGPDDNEGYGSSDFHYTVNISTGGKLIGSFCELTDIGRNSVWAAYALSRPFESRGQITLRNCRLVANGLGISSFAPGEVSFENVTSEFEDTTLTVVSGRARVVNSSFASAIVAAGGTISISSSAFEKGSSSDGLKTCCGSRAELADVVFRNASICLGAGHQSNVVGRLLVFQGCGQNVISEAVVRLDRTLIEGSRTVGSTGAFSIDRGTLAIRNSTFQGNKNADLYLVADSKATLSNTTFRRDAIRGPWGKSVVDIEVGLDVFVRHSNGTPARLVQVVVSAGERQYTALTDDAGQATFFLFKARRENAGDWQEGPATWEVDAGPRGPKTVVSPGASTHITASVTLFATEAPRGPIPGASTVILLGLICLIAVATRRSESL